MSGRHEAAGLRERRRAAMRTAIVLAAVAVAIYAWAIVSRL